MNNRVRHQKSLILSPHVSVAYTSREFQRHEAFFSRVSQNHKFVITLFFDVWSSSYNIVGKFSTSTTFLTVASVISGVSFDQTSITQKTKQKSILAVFWDTLEENALWRWNWNTFEVKYWNWTERIQLFFLMGSTYPNRQYICMN